MVLDEAVAESKKMDNSPNSPEQLGRRDVGITMTATPAVYRQLEESLARQSGI